MVTFLNHSNTSSYQYRNQYGNTDTNHVIHPVSVRDSGESHGRSSGASIFTLGPKALFTPTLGSMAHYGSTTRPPVSARRNLPAVVGQLLFVIIGVAALALTHMQQVTLETCSCISSPRAAMPSFRKNHTHGVNRKRDAMRARGREGITCIGGGGGPEQSIGSHSNKTQLNLEATPAAAANGPPTDLAPSSWASYSIARTLAPAEQSKLRRRPGCVSEGVVKYTRSCDPANRHE